MMRSFPNACKDRQGRLRVGAAVGVREYERMESLIAKDVDVLVVDSAHGHSSNVIETVRGIKQRSDIDVVAGNIATKEGCLDLIRAGADAVKVGIGPGSICTTRVISESVFLRLPRFPRPPTRPKSPTRRSSPMGGIRYSGDMTKAIAAGAHSIMVGGLFAGLTESPWPTDPLSGRTFKVYRGMGSSGAMIQGSSERYRQGQRSWCPRAWKVACRSKGPPGRSSTSWSADFGPEWVIAAPRTLTN